MPITLELDYESTDPIVIKCLQEQAQTLVEILDKEFYSFKTSKTAFENMIETMEHLSHINYVIEYFGGTEVLWNPPVSER